MHLLDNQLIDTFCRRAANYECDWPQSATPVDQILDFYLIDMFRNFYNTGLRYNELFLISRWSKTAGGEYKCNTLKGSNPRYFNPIELSDYFITCIDNNVDPYQMCRYSTAVRWFKRAIYPQDIFFAKGGISLHIFRHNKCKQMKDDLFTVQEISDYLGEVDNKNTNEYINSELYTY
jgi:hypothetical protein